MYMVEIKMYYTKYLKYKKKYLELKGGSHLEANYADPTLKKDREIVLAAVQQNEWAIQYADRTLRTDSTIAAALK